MNSLFSWKLVRNIKGSGKLCLSYDDGPGPETTPRLLDLLDSHGVKATFFLVGARVEAAPWIADSLRNQGHEIGCHTWQHLHAWKSAPWHVARDIQRGFTSLQPWISPSHLFRPPHGKITPLTWWQVRNCGAHMAWWTIDSGDTHQTIPGIDCVIRQAMQGGVLLMHDSDRRGTDGLERRNFVLSLTERVIGMAKRHGLEIVPFGSLPR